MQQPHFSQAPGHIGHVLWQQNEAKAKVNPTCQTKSETEDLSVKKTDPIDMNIIYMRIYIYILYYIIYIYIYYII